MKYRFLSRANRGARRAAVWGALLVAGLAIGAATARAADPKTSQLYENALTRYEKKDYAGAIIQLKNVLRSDSRNLSAQVLLGKALLENGEVGAAEVALTEALHLGVNRAEVAVPLARSLILQGRSDEVLNDARFVVDGLPRGAQVPLLLTRAAAATDVGDLRAVLKSVQEARAIDPADPGSWTAEVPARIRGGQPKEALAAADKAVALAPDSAAAHFARGEALHVVPDLKGAQASYGKAIELDPGHADALLARAGIHLDFDRVDAAAADLAAAAKRAPRDPRGLYLRALVAERQGRKEEARQALNELTAMLDPIPVKFLRYRPQTQILGGLAHYGLGQREKARPYLEAALRGQPGHPVAKLLASIYLADRNVDRAIEVLDPYLRAHPTDSQARLMLASAQMAQGRYARATQLMQDALKVADQPQYRAALGLSLVGSARFAEALKEFETAFARDPAQLQAGYALGSLYLQSGRAADAVRVAEALDKAHPRNPGVLNLLGAARRAKGDAAGSRAAYQAAAAADPAFASAQVGLARLDADAGDVPKAVARLESVLAKEAANIEALALRAEIAERNRQLGEAQRWLMKADEVAGPDNAGPALMLVDFHLRNNQAALAREAIKRAQSKAPDAVPTLVVLARVQLATGDAAGARSTLARAAGTAGYNAVQLTQIAILQNQSGSPQFAAHSLDKALSERPDYLPALALRADIEIRLGELPKAEQRARQIIAANPKIGLGHALLGDIALARRQRDAALAAFRKAHELDNSTDSLMRLFAATARQDPPAAMRLAEQWLAGRPADTVVRRALADTQLRAGNLPAARRHYEALLQLEPDNSEAMNNLANVMVAQKDPGALRVAERALTLSPAAPHVIGTAGWAAFNAGQTDRAIQLLRDARLRDPDNPDTRYFLGSVLASVGRTSEAREELTAALGAPRGLSYRTDAERLLGTLK